MWFADVLPRAYLAFIYLMPSSSAADFKDNVQLNNIKTARMASSNSSTSHCVVLLECRAFNRSSLCCLQTESDLISNVKNLNENNCSSISTFDINNTAVNLTTSNVSLDLSVNITEGCPFLDSNASRKTFAALTNNSNATWNDNTTVIKVASSKRRSLYITSIYLTIIISLTSGFFACVLFVIIFVCFSQGCKRADQVKLKSRDEHKQELRSSYRSLDSSRDSDDTDTSFVDVHNSSAANIETPDFSGFPYLNSSSENCFETSKDTGKYCSNADNVSEVLDVKSMPTLHKTSRCLSEPGNIYDVPKQLDVQERNSCLYVSLCDVHSMTDIFLYTNCTKGQQPLKSGRPTQLKSVIYSEADIYSRDQESDIYSKPVVFKCSERQAFKFEGKCLNGSYVNSDNDMVHL